jgi:hypothetical protein
MHKTARRPHDIDRDIARGNDIVTRLMGGVALGGLIGGASTFGGGLALGAVVGGTIGIFVPSVIDNLVKHGPHSKS